MESLDAVSLAFNDWRYVHEEAKELSTDFSFLKSLANAVQEKALALVSS